jgi:MFS family permease
MANYAFLAFDDMCVQVLLPLVFSTSIPLGGLGFDHYRIGTIVGAWGFTNAFVQGFLLGPIVRRFGARKPFIASQMSYAVVIGLYPPLTYFSQRAGRADAKVLVVMVVQLILQMSGSLGYGASLRSSLSSINLIPVIFQALVRYLLSTAAPELRWALRLVWLKL